MNVTEGLRGLLSEAGVRWRPSGTFPTINTVIVVGGVELLACEDGDDTLRLTGPHLMPEQVVAVLGAMRREG